MHRDFADWYRLASLEPDAPTLENRWTAVEGITESIDVSETTDLARLSLVGPDTESSPLTNRLREKAKEVDELFPMRANDLELQVMASAVAAQVLEGEKSDVATGTALRLIGSAFTRQPPVIPEILDLATSYVNDAGLTVRRREVPETKSLSKTQLEKALEDLAAVLPQNQLPQLNEPLMAAFKATASLAVRSADRSESAVDRVAAQLAIRDEELDILWWLLGQQSRVLETEWNQVDTSTATIVAAWELADLTALVPGPVGARSFLARVLAQTIGGAAEPIEVAEAVTSVARGLRLKLLERAPSPSFATPIISHVAKSADVTDDKAWRRAAETTSGIATGAVRPLDLSYHLYLELLQASLGESA